MNSIILALRSMKIQKWSLIIVLLQLSMCFSILVYSLSSLINQFNIVIVSNGTYKDYYRLTRDILFVDNYYYNYESSVDFFTMVTEYMNEKHIETIDDEAYLEIYGKYIDLQEREFDEKHYLGKYQYIDLYNYLLKCGLVSDIKSNYWTIFSSTFGENRYDVNILMMDEDIFSELLLNTENNVDLKNYKCSHNYFYAIMYPNVSIGEGTKPPYRIGDILVDERVYNMSSHKFETFYYEIIDVFTEPTYTLTELEYSGADSEYRYLDKSFLNSQSIKYNGALVVLKPQNFNRSDYRYNFDEIFTLVKLNDNITEDEYNEFIDKVIECGFNIIDLNEAKDNTIQSIWQFIKQNCFMLLVSLIMVVFSIISVSILSGVETRHEIALFRICGASNNKLKLISSIKWAILFILSMIIGLIIAVIYSKITDSPTYFIVPSSFFSVLTFIFLYIMTFMLSYKSASEKNISSVSSEENNND